ncbi:uncharacterized protein LOC143099283 [Alosa pseudoharengus]|uniref:uncharacterized protein LOC143099283 n=1 Tax=Alosa pseudoharengus TaxID=34774 RepID=UPI003F89275E
MNMSDPGDGGASAWKDPAVKERITETLFTTKNIHHARPPSPVPSYMLTQSMDYPRAFTGEPSQTTIGAHTTSPSGVVCIVCEQTAVKTCLTCQGSYCGSCIIPHHTIPALLGHKLVEANTEVGKNKCLQHNRELGLFCRTHQTAICVVCLVKEHNGHDIISNETDPDAGTYSFYINQLIPKCKKVKKGSTTCYLLPTEKSDISQNSAVRRWTYGKRDQSKPTKTILIVGETGTGKTTLINTMVNHMLGVQWENRVWFQIIEDDKKKSQTESQTTAVTVYELYPETNPSCLRIIDTPGYAATDGIEFDHQISENLHVLFRSEDGIHDIEVVGLVVKAGQNRLTIFQHYIFHAILSLFGKDIDKKIVVFITHSDGLPAPNIITALNEAGVPCAKSGGKPLIFMFNNRQLDNHEKEQEDVYQALWKSGNKSMKKFFNILQEFDKTEVKMTEGVLRERKRLEACVNNLQDAIKMEELKENELQQIQRALEEKKEKFLVDEPYKDKVPIKSSRWHLNKGATICTRCEENCHYPGCWWVKDLSWCSAMKNNRCTVCTGGCHFSDHVKEMNMYVPKTRKVMKTTEDLKQQYEEQVDYKKALEKDLSETKANQWKLVEEAYQCIEELEKIALKKNAFSTRINLEFVIKKMKEKGDDLKVQKLEELNKEMEASSLHWVIDKVRDPQKMLSDLYNNISRIYQGPSDREASQLQLDESEKEEFGKGNNVRRRKNKGSSAREEKQDLLELIEMNELQGDL